MAKNLKRLILFLSLLALLRWSPSVSLAQEAFFLQPINFDLSSPPQRPRDVFVQSSLGSIGFFWELLGENLGRKSDDRIRLASERIAFLTRPGSRASIEGGERGERPPLKFWEFWKYKQLTSWEANLADYDFLMNEEINAKLAVKEAEVFRVNQLVELGRIISRDKKDLQRGIDDLVINSSQKDYLQSLVDGIFKRLLDRLSLSVPVPQNNEYYYSLYPLVTPGRYSLWLGEVGQETKDFLIVDQKKPWLTVKADSSLAPIVWLKEEKLEVSPMGKETENQAKIAWKSRLKFLFYLAVFVGVGRFLILKINPRLFLWAAIFLVVLGFFSSLIKKDILAESLLRISFFFWLGGLSSSLIRKK